MEQSLREVVRADFNNDGIEDVLVNQGYWVRQGTQFLWDYRLDAEIAAG